MWAAREGHVDAVRVLVELGANIEAADKVRDGCIVLGSAGTPHLPLFVIPLHAERQKCHAACQG